MECVYVLALQSSQCFPLLFCFSLTNPPITQTQLKNHPVLTHIHWIALFDVFLLLNPAVDIQSARLVFANEMESSSLLQINNSASIGFHFTSLKWQEPHLYSTQLYRITEIASIVLSPAEYFTEETNRFSRALLFPNHGIKFCKNCFTYQAALSGFVKAPHLAGSEKAILSGSVSKILHFCIAEQKARATFVNSSKQRSDGGRQFAVCPKKSSFSPDKYQQRACPAKKWGC